MAFNLNEKTERCPVCGMQANVRKGEQGELVDCSQCGDFEMRYELGAFGSPISNEKLRALASHFIRRMQTAKARPILDQSFFESLKESSLPTPLEAMDNFIIYLAGAVRGRPGTQHEFNYGDGTIISTIGVCSPKDAHWVIQSLRQSGYLDGAWGLNSCGINLTALGWTRYEQLITAQISSRYAFFARKFDNQDLDLVFERCLYPTVKSTGYELRTVTQKAGPVDAIIEDEIRRCRFLIADLTDGNNGAYWEAGFAEGLGKPVIYICRDADKETGAPLKTHFDTDHRHTVRWSLGTLDETAKRLKAVIRNTLLGDAIQSDE